MTRCRQLRSASRLTFVISRSLVSCVNNTPSQSDWIAHIFEHPVADPAWHWSIDATAWEGRPEDTVVFIADTFERSGELLARFTDEQLNQGFWYQRVAILLSGRPGNR